MLLPVHQRDSSKTILLLTSEYNSVSNFKGTSYHSQMCTIAQCNFCLFIYSSVCMCICLIDHVLPHFFNQPRLDFCTFSFNGSSMFPEWILSPFHHFIFAHLLAILHAQNFVRTQHWGLHNFVQFLGSPINLDSCCHVATGVHVLRTAFKRFSEYSRKVDFQFIFYSELSKAYVSHAENQLIILMSFY